MVFFPGASALVWDMSSIDQIYEEFRKACDEHPELAPLKPLADLDENNQLTNFDVFKIKDEYIQHNVETRQAYDAEVPKGTKEVALSLVQAESEPRYVTHPRQF